MMFVHTVPEQRHVDQPYFILNCTALQTLFPKNGLYDTIKSAGGGGGGCMPADCEKALRYIRRRNRKLMKKEDVLFEKMRPHQIRECRRRGDIAFLPLGSLEWHGIHNPVGTDAAKSHHICCLSALLLGGGAVFPPLVWGVPRDSFYVGTGEASCELISKALGTEPERVSGFCRHGGMDIQEQWLAYQRLLRMCLEHIAGFGFKSIYICSGHNPLVHWARPVAVTFCRASRMAGYPVTVDWGGEFDACRKLGDHGGVWETSLMMEADPSSVDLQALQRNPEFLGIGAGKNAVEATGENGRRWSEECASSIAEEAKWLIRNYPELPSRHRHFR